MELILIKIEKYNLFQLIDFSISDLKAIAQSKNLELRKKLDNLTRGEIINLILKSQGDFL